MMNIVTPLAAAATWICLVSRSRLGFLEFISMANTRALGSTSFIEKGYAGDVGPRAAQVWYQATLDRITARRARRFIPPSPQQTRCWNTGSSWRKTCRFAASAMREGCFRVKSSSADDIVYAAEVPQKADQIHAPQHRSAMTTLFDDLV